jgi:N-acetylglutamate synthase-like GNAT family acetyltransferase
MRIRAARYADLPAVAALLDNAGLPDRDIDSHLATLLVGEQRGAILAAGALEPLGAACLLRSVAVSPACRGRGWGARMTSRLLDLAQSIGIPDTFLLTTGAGKYFSGLGFVAVPRDDAPELLRRTRQFSDLCPSTAVLMRIRLDAGARNRQPNEEV